MDMLRETGMITKAKPKKANKSWRDIKKRWQLFVFLFPPLLYILIFKYYPMFGVQIAFKDFTPGQGIWGSPWVGFKHFKAFFNSFAFGRIVKNTIRISVYSLITGFPLAIIFALLINSVRNEKFKKTVQTITYLPHFISTVVLVGILIQIFNPVIGLYGNIARAIVGKTPKDILGSSGAFIHLYNWSGIWQNLGWSTIIYIAVLTSVDPELHEAAQIDGASRVQRIRHVDFPALLPTAAIMLILRAGGIMSVGFEKVYLMQNNLNLVQSETIATHVYKVGLTAGANNFSFGSAIGLFNSLINCLLLVTVNTISRRLQSEGASLW